MTMDLIPGLAGGALIGLSAALLLLIVGRTAGVSGIIGGLLSPASADFQWQLAFLIGLAGAAAALTLAAPDLVRTPALPAFWKVLIGGFAVGLGTSLARGCTSGHGICGLPRLAPRSGVAVATFFVTAMITASLLS